MLLEKLGHCLAMRFAHADPSGRRDRLPHLLSERLSQQGALNLVLVSGCWSEASRPSGFEIRGPHVAGMPEAVLRCRTGGATRFDGRP
ncbi:hypothetical protein CDEST_11118 [Colletotrichum destructivum]|uniref:Uncharacterized protein n=1 Tax=Colletotrichum destructivum TaxID=34406 RepID=A0AAX4ISA2_9PEZI|nr:hypothetical protein CDEST_11118 [Colletotrichum destructivum]